MFKNCSVIFCFRVFRIFRGLKIDQWQSFVGNKRIYGRQRNHLCEVLFEITTEYTEYRVFSVFRGYSKKNQSEKIPNNPIGHYEQV